MGAIAHPANIYRPLGYWLAAIHSSEDVPLDGATAFGILLSGYSLTFISGSLNAFFTVAFVPDLELRPVAEWVNVHFHHITQISSYNVHIKPRGWGNTQRQESYRVFPFLQDARSHPPLLLYSRQVFLALSALTSPPRHSIPILYHLVSYQSWVIILFLNLYLA